MDESKESRVWQRVRGGDRAEQLRSCLAAQGELLSIYRALSRRGGKCRQLYEQKQSQTACLRGLLRAVTGQSAALPRGGEAAIDLLRCHERELQFLRELTELSRDAELGPIFDALREKQKQQCRLLLELIGSM